MDQLNYQKEVLGLNIDTEKDETNKNLDDMDLEDASKLVILGSQTERVPSPNKKDLTKIPSLVVNDIEKQSDLLSPDSQSSATDNNFIRPPFQSSRRLGSGTLTPIMSEQEPASSRQHEPSEQDNLLDREESIDEEAKER